MKAKSPVYLVGGVLYGVLALWTLINMFTYFQYNFSVATLLIAAAYGVIAYCMITNLRSIVCLAGFGVMALCSLFSLSLSVASLLSTLAALAVFGVVLSAMSPYLPKIKPYAKQFWFAPACLILLAGLLSIVVFLVQYESFSFLNLLRTLVSAAAALLACMWAAYPNGLPGAAPSQAQPAGSYTTNGGYAPNGQPAYNANPQQSYAPVEDGYCGMAKHVLLLLFTFGIWQYVWIYRVTNYLNRTPGEEYRNPTTKLLLCMFVPFYYLYWIFVSAKRIDKLALSRGIQSDIAVLSLVLALFIGIVPPIMMQDKINQIASRGQAAPQYSAPQYTAPQYSAPQYTAPQPQAPQYSAPQYTAPQPQAPQYTAPQPQAPGMAPNVADELKRYQELLAAGLITNEEYDAKRRQLLGL